MSRKKNAGAKPRNDLKNPVDRGMGSNPPSRDAKACRRSGERHDWTPVCPDTQLLRRWEQLHPGLGIGSAPSPTLVVETRGGNVERVFRWYPAYRGLDAVAQDVDDYEVLDWEDIQEDGEGRSRLSLEIAKRVYPDDFKQDH